MDKRLVEHVARALYNRETLLEMGDAHWHEWEKLTEETYYRQEMFIRNAETAIEAINSYKDTAHE